MSFNFDDNDEANEQQKKVTSFFFLSSFFDTKATWRMRNEKLKLFSMHYHLLFANVKFMLSI